MRLRKWQPFSDMVRFMDGFEDLFRSNLGESGHESVAAWSPNIDIHENDDEYIFRAELPGLEKKDINVEVENDQLIISGEKKQDREAKDENCHRYESSYGRFYRSFRLPSGIDQEKIKAVMKNGVLQLNVAKAEEKKRKAISVSVN